MYIMCRHLENGKSRIRLYDFALGEDQHYLPFPLAFKYIPREIWEVDDVEGATKFLWKMMMGFVRRTGIIAVYTFIPSENGGRKLAYMSTHKDVNGHHVVQPSFASPDVHYGIANLYRM